MARRGADLRRAALALAGSGLAVAGLLILIVLWVRVASGSMVAGAGRGEPCVAAAAAGADSAEVHYAVLPPAAECRWSPGGVAQKVLLDSAPTGLSWGAAAAVLGGVALIAAAGWSARRMHRAGGPSHR